MPYTLAKFFLWGLLLAIGGGIIGWLLRSLKCRAEVARARVSTVDHDEVDRLRRRLANLEPAVAERDRLRMELADVRGSSAGALGFASSETPSIVPDAVDAGAEEAADADAADAGDAGDAESAGSMAPIGLMSDGSDGAQPAPDAEPEAPPAPEEPTAEPEAAESLDLAAAKDVLGKKVKLDDLTVVEGIGPKIAELCSGIGITTWQGLSVADVADLQSMLDAAGSRFQMHKPGTWPQQAGLLAAGKWAEFKQLTDELTGGT